MSLGNRIAALVTVLIFALVPFVFSAPAMAQNSDPLQGFIISDNTPCYEKVGDENPWGRLAAQTEAMIYTDPAQEWVFIGVYPDPETGSRSSCWVKTTGVSVGMGAQSEEITSDDEPFEDAPVVDQLPIVPREDNPAGLPAEILYKDTINSDDTRCRTAPSLDAEVHVHLVSGEVVDILSEDIGGWRWVGTEGGQCYVWFELIGPITESPAIVPVVDEPVVDSAPIEQVESPAIVLSEPEVEDPPLSPAEKLESVRQLPDTGSGEGIPLDITPIFVLGLVAVGVIIMLVGRWFMNHKDSLRNRGNKANQQWKGVVRYFGSRNEQ